MAEVAKLQFVNYRKADAVKAVTRGGKFFFSLHALAEKTADDSNPRINREFVKIFSRRNKGDPDLAFRFNAQFPDFRGNLPQFIAHMRTKCKAHVGRIMQTRASL